MAEVSEKLGREIRDELVRDFTDQQKIFGAEPSATRAELFLDPILHHVFIEAGEAKPPAARRPPPAIRPRAQHPLVQPLAITREVWDGRMPRDSARLRRLRKRIGRMYKYDAWKQRALSAVCAAKAAGRKMEEIACEALSILHDFEILHPYRPKKERR